MKLPRIIHNHLHVQRFKNGPMKVPRIIHNHLNVHRFKERPDERTDDQTQSSVRSILIEIWINEIKLAHSMSRRKSLLVTKMTGKQPHRQPSGKLESLWDDLLSRRPEKVQEAYLQLEMAERKAVITHLQRMVDEAGWQPEQRASAKAALQALERLAQ